MPVCEGCGKEFDSEAALAQHAAARHPAKSVPPPSSQSKEKKRGGKSLRRKNRHPVLVGIVAVGVALGVGMYLLVAPSFASPPLPCAGGEYIHVHPYLQIKIEGQDVTIPADVGIVQAGSCLEPVHTHDSSGILHIELSQTDASNVTLGDFFAVWKYTYGTATFNGASHPIAFNSTDILGYKADSAHRVVLLVDGKPSTAWGSLQLGPLDYCDASMTGPPCSPTAVGNPSWDGGAIPYPYGTGHTIVIEYISGAS